MDYGVLVFDNSSNSKDKTDAAYCREIASSRRTTLRKRYRIKKIDSLMTDYINKVSGNEMPISKGYRVAVAKI